MKEQRISTRIERKMDDWLSTLPTDIAREVKDNIVVTGGSIASMLLNERVNDYDVYLNNIRSVMILARYYCEEFVKVSDVVPYIRITFKDYALIPSAIKNDKDIHLDRNNRAILTYDGKAFDSLIHYDTSVARIEIFIRSNGFAESNVTDQDYTSDNQAEISDENADQLDGKYIPKYISSNAITLSDSLQIVIRFFGDANKIHESFDFVHATNYWTFRQGLVTNKEAILSILSRELHYTGSLYPLASIFRQRKFLKRGWSIHVGNYIKMGMQLSELDLNNVDVLEEQLTGVDALYMRSLIDSIHLSGKERVESGYVCTLVDRMMGYKE